MRAFLFSLFLVALFADRASAADEPSRPFLFDFGFVPGAEETTEEDILLKPNESVAQSVGGFQFGFRSQDDQNSNTAWHSSVNVTEYQTLVEMGLSSILFEKDDLVVGAQLLGGRAFGRRGFEESWHASFDLYGARPINLAKGNYLKFGAFVDIEEQFGKWGPELGLLLGANSDHPVTIDLAYGAGLGDPYFYSGSLWDVADDDLQLQAGVFLNENLQVGVTGQYNRWDDFGTTVEDWKTGGFVRWFADSGLSLGLGVASGNLGTTGFFNVTLQPKSHHEDLEGGKEPIPDRGIVDPGNWMSSPVRRLRNVQVRTSTQAITGSLSGVYSVNGDPSTLFPSNLDRLTATYTNTSAFTQVVTIVSIEAFDGSIVPIGTTATLGPGGTITGQTGFVNAAGAGAVLPATQTVVLNINGRTFSVNLVFGANPPPMRGNVNNTAGPVPVGP